MNDVGLYLVMIGGLFLLGAGGEMLFPRTRVPDVVWLILAGVLARSFGLIDPATLDGVMPLFSALTLIVVLFEGGRKIVVHELVKLAPRATALALASFLTSTLVVAIIVQLAAWTGLLSESWTFGHSLMVGAILGGTSSLIFMPSMELSRVHPKVSSLLSLESALGDALCVVVAVAMMSIVKSGESVADSAIGTLAKAFGVGLGAGVVLGWCWFPVLRFLAGNVYGYPITFAAMLFLYALVDNFGGSSAMAVLTFAVMVGNAEPLMKLVGFSLGDKPLALDDSIVTVHTQANFIVKAFFFSYIGLLLAPPWWLLLVGALIGLALLVARIPAAWLVAKPPAFTEDQRKLVIIALPRGLAAGVLATLPVQLGITGTERLPTLVFAAVVTTIALFSIGFRRVREGKGSYVIAGAFAQAVAAARGPTPPEEAMPDGHLPNAEPVPPSQPSVTVHVPAPERAEHERPPLALPPGAMPDGSVPQAGEVETFELRPLAAPRKTTAHGLPPVPSDRPAPPSPVVDEPAPASGSPSTLYGLPVVPGGPPKPAEPSPGPKFIPSSSDSDPGMRKPDPEGSGSGSAT